MVFKTFVPWKCCNHALLLGITLFLNIKDHTTDAFTNLPAKSLVPPFVALRASSEPEHRNKLLASRNQNCNKNWLSCSEPHDRHPSSMPMPGLDPPDCLQRDTKTALNIIDRRRMVAFLTAGIAGAAVYAENGFPTESSAGHNSLKGLTEQGRKVLRLKARQACGETWSLDWRNSEKGRLCLESDGSLWRKIDESIRSPDGKTGFLQAEATYPLPFIAYLARFILNFDPRWSQWWSSRQAALPPGLDAHRDHEILEKDFASFAASVEYGLFDYVGSDGVQRLADELEAAYGSLGPEARRQLGLLFAMLGKAQPVQAIARLAGTQVERDTWDSGGTWQAALENTRDMAFSRDEGKLPALLPVSMPLHQAVTGQYTLAAIVAAEDFGVRGFAPVKRERQVTAPIYGVFALSGLLGCAGMHTLTVPLDVVKTREQVAPGRYGSSLTQGIQSIWREEGLSGLMSGLVPTLVGYSWYGMTVYPGYELLKRTFIQMVGEAGDSQYHACIVLLAGACSTAVACLGVCPAEATRIRQVASPSYAPTALKVVQRMIDEEGFFSLYKGFNFLLARQILFGMVKFLVFDTFANGIYAALPELSDTGVSGLMVSLYSGAVAGVLSSIASQPADTVLTKMKESGALPATTVIRQIFETYGFSGFFLGLWSRCAWAGAIIAGQFLLYDLFKSGMQVSSDDLTVFLDVMGSIRMVSPNMALTVRL